MEDELEIGLDAPPRRQLRPVSHLQRDLEIPDRTIAVVKAVHVAVEAARLVTAIGIGDGDAEDIVVVVRQESFVGDAAIGIEVDLIAPGGIAGEAGEEPDTVIVRPGFAPDDLIGDEIEAVMSVADRRPSGTCRIGERAAGIVFARIAKPAGVVVAAELVNPRQTGRILLLIERIGGFGNAESAVADAETGAA